MLNSKTGPLEDLAKAHEAMATALREIIKAGITVTEGSREEGSSEPEKSVSLEDVRGKLAEKSKAGFTSEIKELLKKYGASRLSDVAPESYKALYEDAEVLGNG